MSIHLTIPGLFNASNELDEQLRKLDHDRGEAARPSVLPRAPEPVGRYGQAAAIRALYQASLSTDAQRSRGR